MNKKQAVIILTLLVLIICAGVIATKMNDNLYVNVDDPVKTEVSQSSTLKANCLRKIVKLAYGRDLRMKIQM